MSGIQDELLFDGVSGLSCEDFIRGVRRFSLGEGRPKDDEWIALSAASFMGGQALRWYESLEEDIQESWKLLRRAMLVRWPATFDPSPAAAYIPTAPAAPPLGLAVPTPSAVPLTTLLAATGNQSGRIKILRDGNPTEYISRVLDTQGRCTTTQNVNRALVLRFSQTATSKACDIVFDTGNSHQKLGLVLENKTMEGGSVSHLGLAQAVSDGHLIIGLMSRFILRASGEWRPASKKPTDGPAKTAVWLPLLDGTILACWEGENGSFQAFDICLHTEVLPVIMVFTSYGRILAAMPELSKVALVFDPL